MVFGGGVISKLMLGAISRKSDLATNGRCRGAVGVGPAGDGTGVQLVEKECADGLADPSADSLSVDRFGQPGEGVGGAQDRVADCFGALHPDDASVVAND